MPVHGFRKSALDHEVRTDKGTAATGRKVQHPRLVAKPVARFLESCTKTAEANTSDASTERKKASKASQAEHDTGAGLLHTAEKPTQGHHTENESDAASNKIAKGSDRISWIKACRLQF